MGSYSKERRLRITLTEVAPLMQCTYVFPAYFSMEVNI